MPEGGLFVGLDLGTSGARAVVVDASGAQIATARSAMADHPGTARDPAVWWGAARAALQGVCAQVKASAIRAIAVDATSGTMVATDSLGTPLGQALMYNDPCEDAAVLAAIAAHAPATSAAHGRTSALARALVLARLHPAHLLHQADWIAFQLCGRIFSDANNALKTGYDPQAACWPDWIAQTGLNMALLPRVVDPGTDIAPVTTATATAFGLSRACRIVAGTTDGCASFLATGACRPGDGVSALGTTLTVKLLSDRPIFAPHYGIYSHRILGQWLAGGASNSGGGALLVHFSADQMAALTPRIDPETCSGLDYYPLPAVGERFPINDPHMPPRLSPRPAEDALFLQALFEGVAEVEALAYARLAELGAPPLRRLRSVGGGAANPVWTRIRERRLGVPMPTPHSAEAAFGTALLARRGITV